LARDRIDVSNSRAERSLTTLNSSFVDVGLHADRTELLLNKRAYCRNTLVVAPECGTRRLAVLSRMPSPS